MAKNDTDLFDRLRQAGLRKQVAKTLSEIGDGTSKKAHRAARNAVTDLHSLVDEIERRLPGAAADTSATGRSTGRKRTRSPATGPPAARPRAATAGAARRGQRPTTPGRRTAGPAVTTAAAPVTSGARAPRGQNKAKIFESLAGGPKTASEIAKETQIGTGTVGATLIKLAKAGEVVKADRGYSLPK